MKAALVITVGLLILVSAPLTHSQQDGLIKILKPVEEKQRSRLAARLRLFMEYQRTQRWSDLYKLIDKINREHVGAEKFAKETAATPTTPSSQSLGHPSSGRRGALGTDFRPVGEPSL